MSERTVYLSISNIPDNLVHTVEDHGVAPHGDCSRIVSEGQAEGANKEPFRVGEDPDTQHAEQIDKVAEIGQEVVVALRMVREVADGHEICQLGAKPYIKVLRASTDQVAADEDIEHTSNKRHLLSEGDSCRLVPLLSQALYTLLHPSTIFFQLLIGGRRSALPFTHNTILGIQGRRLELLPLLAHLLLLHGDCLLPFLQAL